MEIVENILICGRIQKTHRFCGIVPVAAHKNRDVSRISAYTRYTLTGALVPDIYVALVGHFVEQLERHMTLISRKAPCDLLPESLEALTVCLVLEEARLCFTVVEGKACGLVEVYDYVKVMGDRCVNSFFHPVEAIFPVTPVLCFKDVVVYGQTYMIQSPSLYYLKVLFGDKVVQHILAVIALREPSSQIHAPVKTCELFHKAPPLM